MNILIKLAAGHEVNDADIIEALSEVCEREHGGCSAECPVYLLNEYKVPNQHNSKSGCDCFKDGVSMLSFIRATHKLPSR